MNHDRITRTVTNLPDGVRTVTESADPRIAQLLKDHVTQMGQRVETGDDPGLPIESPALRRSIAITQRSTPRLSRRRQASQSFRRRPTRRPWPRCSSTPPR